MEIRALRLVMYHYPVSPPFSRCERRHVALSCGAFMWSFHVELSSPAERRYLSPNNVSNFASLNHGDRRVFKSKLQVYCFATKRPGEGILLAN